MKQRLLIAMTGVSLLVGVAAAPTLAAGAPARYQVGTTTYTIAVLDTYIHTFVVTTDPCTGSLAITGATPQESGYYTTETVTGTLAGGVVTFEATYDGPYSPGYEWSGSFPVEGGALGGMFTGTVTVVSTTSTVYENHGQYVRAMGGGPDAAHSCIGMPLGTRGDKVDGLSPARMAAAATVAAKLEKVVERLQAGGHASGKASTAVQKRIDATGRTDKSAAARSKAPSHPSGSSDGRGQGSHQGKP